MLKGESPQRALGEEKWWPEREVVRACRRQSNVEGGITLEGSRGGEMED